MVCMSTVNATLSSSSVLVAMLSFQYKDHLSFCTLGCSVMVIVELPPLKRPSRLTVHPAGTCGRTGPSCSCLVQHSKSCASAGTPATVASKLNLSQPSHQSRRHEPCLGPTCLLGQNVLKIRKTCVGCHWSCPSAANEPDED